MRCVLSTRVVVVDGEMRAALLERAMLAESIYIYVGTYCGQTHDIFIFPTIYSNDQGGHTCMQVGRKEKDTDDECSPHIFPGNSVF